MTRLKDKHIKAFWESIDPDMRDRLIRAELEEQYDYFPKTETPEHVMPLKEAFRILIDYYGGRW